MIELTALSGRKIWVNPHIIESMEATPDTTLSLVDGKRMVVAEKVDEVIRLIIAYRRSISFFGESD